MIHIRPWAASSAAIPLWDQYRLVKVAIAGSLFQHGWEEWVVSKHYLKGLFQHQVDPCRIAIDH